VSIGVDLAKKRDETVFTVVDHRDVEDSDTPHKVVPFVRATQESYDQQYEYLKALVRRTHATRVSIDETGLGQMFVEKAKNDPELTSECRVEGISFTNEKKENWATRFKGELQGRTVTLLDHPDLKRQIHGIQRTRTENGFYKFAAEGSRHDDYFWSLMLAMYGQGRVRPRFSVLGR
jgi:phage FluMu gp28-like protein